MLNKKSGRFALVQACHYSFLEIKRVNSLVVVMPIGS